MPKVDCLDRNQVQSIVSKGFTFFLKINATPVQIVDLASHVFNITLGVAQRVHEYCEALAQELSSVQWTLTEPVITRADQAWLLDGLRQAYTVVESHMNSRNTAIARRNQVLFSIGTIDAHQFDASKVEEAVKRHFPETINEQGMGIGAILNELASGEKPLLVKNQKTNSFRVRDPRFIMCIRLILFKNKTTGLVSKKQFRAR